jgi:hypothetical protein
MTVMVKKGRKERIGFAKLVSNFKGHSRTVREHRRKVFEHCRKAGIPLQGLLHDLSKYSPTEFICGVKYYQGTRSPNEGERESYGFSYAWMHHKGRNKHHFEYWTDYDPVTKRMMPVKMPVRYVKEMFCDRVAASKIYNRESYTDGDALAYFMKSRDRRLKYFMIHPDTSRLIEKLLRMLKEEGEEKTFAYIRRLRRY